jgi:DNA-binding CsgD family transcriptional regulator
LACAKSSLEVIENLDVGVVLLGAGATVLHCNAYARDVFSKRDGLLIGNRRMTAQSALDSKRLGSVLSRASLSTSAPASAGGEVLVSRPSGKRTYIVRVSPIRGVPLCGPDVPLAIAFINDPERRIQPDFFRLRALGLTAAEARIVALLAVGKDVAQIARLLRVQQNTVRIHLKSIFRKTETRNQADLVSFLLAVQVPLVYGPIVPSVTLSAGSIYLRPNSA